MPPQRLPLWFRAVGNAIRLQGLRVLAGFVPFGEAVYDIAAETLRQLRQLDNEAGQLAALEEAAQASQDEVKRITTAVVHSVAADQPEPIRQALNNYLNQLPATIRQTLKRPSDPTGTTVPAGLQLLTAELIIPLLPARVPRFRSGDRPAGMGNWELVELLGVGGCGEVWLARHPRLRGIAPVALKFCLNATTAKVLRHEAELLDRVMQQSTHPGIVPLRQAYLDADPLCLEYEYVPGGDLAGLVRDWGQPPAGPSLIERSRLVQQLAAIVGHAHRLNPPIVHRDLKPANVLVHKRDSGAVELRVADFGIGGIAAGQAIEQVRRGSTSHGAQLISSLRGAHTPLYASPQQMRGAPPDPRDDVHALGVVWLQLLYGDLASGRPAGKGWRRKLSEQGLSAELLELLESCFDDDPNERPRDASVLSARLAELLTPPGSGPFAGAANPAQVLVPARGPTPAQSGRPTSPGTEPARPLPVRAFRPPTPPASLVVAQSGSADHRSIKEALKAAAPHTRIVVHPGIYRESLVLDKPVELVGEGAVSAIILEATSADCLLMQTDEAVVRGLTLRGRAGSGNGKYYGVDIARGRLLLENCDITSDSLACVAIHGVGTNPTVRNCRIHDGKDCGIHIYDKGRGIIEGCEIFGNTLSGVAIRTGGNPTFRRCLIRDGKVGGFLIYDQGEGLIEDCEIVGNEYAGLEIKKGGNPVIRRCQISRSKQGSGIHCYEGGMGTVEECEIFGNIRAGVRIREGSNPTIRRCRIHDNEGGFYIQENSKGTIEHCEITDNQRAGVDIMQGADTTVRHCKITRNGYEGIWVHDEARATVENCDLTGNVRGAWDIAVGCQVRQSGNRE